MDIKIMYNESSKILARVLKSKFKQEGFNIVDSHADCVCIIGGDGTFLRALRKLNYDSIPVYIGINSGNLGYLQDVHIDKVGDMINYLKSKEEIKANKVELADITYVYSNNKQKDCAVNEIQISGKHYHKIKFELSDCNGFKEEVVSSGIVFATPFGSTAYNKSLGGPVICEGIDALCATLFAPIAYLVYIPLSFFIPSSSGLATVSMPVFAPLTAKLGFSPEVMVMIFSAGNGLVNLFTPTSGAIMGGLSIAKVEWTTWIKWAWKCILCIAIANIVILTVAMLIL